MTTEALPQTEQQQEQSPMPHLRRDVENYLRRRSKVFEHKSNWASDLSDPCERKLVYHRTCWDKQEKPAPFLQGIFDTGTELEHTIVRLYNYIGEWGRPRWELAGHGVKLNDGFLKDHQIGCNPDVFLKVWPEDGTQPKFLGPVDIKTMDPNIFRMVNCAEDLDRKPHLRRYPGQVMMYELASNFEWGGLLLVNKSNLFDHKLIEIPLDYEYAESLIQKSDRINEHLKNGTLPDQLNRTEDCQRCPYKAHCCPECSTGGNLTLLDNEALAEVLLSLDDLDEAKDQISTLEKMRDKLLEPHKGQTLVCGDFIVNWTWQDPQTTPPKPRAGFWKKSIERICSPVEEE